MRVDLAGVTARGPFCLTTQLRADASVPLKTIESALVKRLKARMDHLRKGLAQASHPSAARPSGRMGAATKRQAAAVEPWVLVLVIVSVLAVLALLVVWIRRRRS